MWVCSNNKNSNNASGTSYNNKRQQCTRWGSGNIEEESSCLCPQTWLFHPRQHLCRQCLLSSRVQRDMWLYIWVYMCVCMWVCASLFKSHYKALVRLYLSLPRFRLKHSRFHLSQHDDRFYLEEIWLGTPLQTHTHTDKYTHTLAQLAQFRVSTVDLRGIYFGICFSIDWHLHLC